MARSFRILGTLGRGAFGEVHLTEIRTDEDFVQTLAVKWLHAELSEDPELAGRLRDEARLLGLLDHPNIVRVQGLTRLDGRLAVLMEAVRGCNLARRHLPPRATSEVISAVADALHAAYTAIPPGRTEPLRVVHRDIKPSNIMVTQRGQVKVMDFGVARATFEAREVSTRSQQFGTARYMAPERWLEGLAEAPSDVFSLGITLIELISGAPLARLRLSRQGYQEDATAALERIDDPALRSLTEAMIAFIPTDRPTAAEVVERLAGIALPGDTLRDWAGQLQVPDLEQTDRTGTVVVERTADTIALTAPTTAALTAATAPTQAAPFALQGATTAATAVPPTETAPVEAVPRAPSPVSKRSSALPLATLGLAALLLGIGWWATRSTDTVPAEVPIAATPEPPQQPPEPAPGPPPPAPVEAPLPEPTRVPSPEPIAQPAVPVAPPSARPTPAEPRPAPPPQPAVEPAPSPELETTDTPRIPITFVVDAGLSVSTPFGSLGAGRGVLLLPAGEVVRLAVDHPDSPFGCTIPLGNAPATWSVRRDGTCGER